MIDYILKQKPKALICQDYVAADVFMLGYGNHIPVPFIVVTDGCTGGIRTEMGSQLLCQIAKTETEKYLEELLIEEAKPVSEIQLPVLLRLIKEKLSAAQNLLKLSTDQLLATMQILFIIKGRLYSIRSGDGVAFAFYEDGSFSGSIIEYTPNMPNYLAYRNDPMLSAQLTHQVDAGGCWKTIEDFQVKKDEAYVEGDEANIHRLNYFDVTFVDVPLDPKAKYIGLASDGIGAYYNESLGETIPVTEFLSNLSQIKNPEGNFLVRRFQKMDKLFQSKGFENGDDVGIAIIDLEACRKGSLL